MKVAAEAEVAVEAMAVAPTGSGWLCVPSYVVMRIDMSSWHLCTCTHMHDKSIKSMHRYGVHLIDRSSSQSEATGATINV
jgi:hypothetical protein